METDIRLRVYTVSAENQAVRADVFLTTELSKEPEAAYSRSFTRKLFDEGCVLVNGTAATQSRRLKTGDEVTVRLPDKQYAPACPQQIPLDVVYEDDRLIVVNKPRGMVVHPAAGNPDGTLVNALLYHCGASLSGINGVLRPGIVHRIDKDTSGLLVAAKTDDAHKSLAAQLAAHTMTREYFAVADGRFRDIEGTVDAPIGRDPAQRKRFCVTEKNSKAAVTHFTVLSQFEDRTLLRLKLETGRTHQIRVHMAYLGHPLCGDVLYGGRKANGYFAGQCLHARTLGFDHPCTGQRLEFTSELPDYFTVFLNSLRGEERYVDWD